MSFKTHSVSEDLLSEETDVRYKKKNLPNRVLKKIKEFVKEKQRKLEAKVTVILLPLSVAANIVVVTVVTFKVLKEVADDTGLADDVCGDREESGPCYRASNCTGHAIVARTLLGQGAEHLCCTARNQSTSINLLLSLFLSQRRRSVPKWDKIPNLTAKNKLSSAVQVYLDVDALAVGRLLWIADNPYESDGFRNNIINNGDHFIILKDGMYAIHSQMELRALGLKRPKTFTYKIIGRIGTGNGVTDDATILQRSTKMSPGDLTFTSSVLNEHLRLFKGDVLFVNVSDVSFIYQASTTNSLNMFRL